MAKKRESIPGDLDPLGNALLLASWGLHVIPVHYGSKHPIEKGWPDAALTESEINERFRGKVNVGIATGRGTIGLDIDQRVMTNVLKAEPTLLPPTECVWGHLSATYWTHYVWSAAGWDGRKLNLEWLLPGATAEAAAQKQKACERMGKGQYLLAPGSLHPNEKYAPDKPEPVLFARKRGPIEVDPDELDAAVRRLSAISYLVRLWPQQPYRQEFALALQGGLTQHQMDPDQAQSLIETAARHAGDEEWQKKRGKGTHRGKARQSQGDPTTGWTRAAAVLGMRMSDLRACLVDTLQLGASTSTYKPDKAPGKTQVTSGWTAPPQTLSPAALCQEEAWVPFPVDALPEAIRDPSLAVTRPMCLDPVFGILPSVAACAGAIGNARVIVLDDNNDWVEPSVLWMAVCAPSGEGKSPALYALLGDTMRAGARSWRAYREELKDYRAYLKSPSVEGAEVRRAPLPPERFILEDVTIESLHGWLDRTPRGLFMVHDELASLVNGMNRYSTSSNVSRYLAMHNAGVISVDRVDMEKSLAVERAAVSIFGGIQPGIFNTLLGSDELTNSGYWPRYLLSRPPCIPKEWMYDAIDPQHLAGWRKLLVTLRTLDFRTDDTGHSVPIPLYLSPEAAGLFQAWYNRHHRELWPKTDSLIRATGHKLPGTVGRLALVFHVVEQQSQERCDTAAWVSRDTMARAIRVGEWFANEWARILPQARAEANSSEAERNAGRLLAWLEARGGSGTVREAYRGLTLPVAELLTLVEQLVALGRVARDWDETTPQETPKVIRLRPQGVSEGVGGVSEA